MSEAWWEKYYNSTDYFVVYSLLIDAAQHRGLVTYQEIAEAVGLPLSGNHMGREIGGLLGTISMNELDNDRPMLSAIVVGTSGKPGEGFYAWAKELGRFDGEGKEAEVSFLEQERDAVYKTWQKEYKTA